MQDDAPLRAWREQLEAQYTQMDMRPETVEQYKQRYLKSLRRDDLFRWGYSAYMLHYSDIRTPKEMQLMTTLNAAKLPYSYEFMRMRYLVTASQFFGNAQITNLGERLAKAAPKDVSVRFYMRSSFSLSTAQGKDKAMAYAREMIQIDPARAVGYAAVADIYYNVWIISDAKDIEAGRQAIQGFREYIKHETRAIRAEDRKLAQRIIDIIIRHNGDPGEKKV